MIIWFAPLISPELYKVYVQDICTQFSMTSLGDSEQLLSLFAEVFYAADVTFQQFFRLSGSIQERKLYFRGRHELYGLKAEFSELPNVLAVGSSNFSLAM